MKVYKERPIAYCLGNFWIGSLSDYAWMEREAVIWELTFTPGSSVPAVSLRILKMKEAGLPEIDATGTAANLLSDRSEGIQFSKLGDTRYKVTAK